MQRILPLVGVLFVFVSVSAQTPKSKASKSDAEIKQAIIQESIASCSGSCPCPYNRDRAGRSCGKRSAHSRPGGASPVCYEDDVTEKMVGSYRASHGEMKPPVLPAAGTKKPARAR